MRATAELAAWAADRKAQAVSEVRSMAAARAWRGHPAVLVMQAALDDPAGDIGAVIADEAWPVALLAPLVTAFAADPWFQPSFRIGGDARRMALMLGRGVRGTVALTVTRGGSVQPQCAVASGRVQIIRFIRSGGASIEERATDRPEISVTSALADGDICRIDGRRVAHALIGQRGTLATLTATLHADTGEVREYDRATGALLRTTALDEDTARAQLLLEFLRASGRADATSFAEASHAAAPQLRWEAMREWLLTDARAAMPRLDAMARGDPDDAVRAAASATLVMARERLACPV